MKLSAGQLVAERYEVDDVIGSGGMSVVYRAYDSKLDRFVTLKVLKEDFLSDESLMARFPVEARAAAGLNHQNIVSIYDHGQDEDIIFIVLEYVDGASLKELIVRKAPFDTETCLGVAIQVAEGLAEAHRNNIIHLDIKPQNILITTTSLVKVADFGIARAAKSATLTAGAGSMGSVHYFSPEQARGGYIDYKSDIYSLGIVLFEMATGQLPYEGENEVSIALQHINDPLPNIYDFNPDISQSLVSIITKATEKSPSKRYQTVSEMADDMKRALYDANAIIHVPSEEEDISPTTKISAADRELIRKKKMRQAFLDGDDAPIEEDVEYDSLVYSDFDDPDSDFDDLLDEDFDIGTRPNRAKAKQKPKAKPRKRASADNKSDRTPIYLGVVAGLIAATLLFLLIFNFILGGGESDLAITPNLVGISLEEAEEEAERFGLVLSVIEWVYSEDISYGYVISQEQNPGTHTSQGSVIEVTLSQGGIEAYLMPRVTLLTLEEAMELLEEIPMLLEIRYDREYDDAFAVNIVFAQDPLPDESLEPGDLVLLSVSLGSIDAPVEVPDLLGLAEIDALVMLRDTRLISGEITHQESTEVPAGHIISQAPEAGATVNRESPVSLVVSTGEEPAPTPTPVPTPTPEPEPEEEVVHVDEEPTPTLTTRPIQIHPWPFPEGTEYIHVVVTRQIGNEEEEDFWFNPQAAADSFPLTVNLQGTGLATFRIYSVEEGGARTLRASEPIDFGAPPEEDD